MNTSELLSQIDAEISRLQQVRALLGKGGAVSSGKRKKRVLSADARERIAAAQRKRWAAVKRASK